MPLAKRTDRTEARRRYRAQQAELADAEPGDETVEAAATAGRKPRAKADQPAPAVRPGIMNSFKGAVRPLNLRGDLLALPQVVTNWGFLAAMGITLAAAIWFVVAYSPALSEIPAGTPVSDQLETVVGTNSIPYYLGTMALQPPPAIGAFLIGFAAKRASWLGGLIYGIFVTILAIVVLQTPAGRLLAGDGSMDAVLVGHAAWSPVGAMLFASAAAWYRRFLDLANPNRGQRRQDGKAQQGRGKTAKPKTSR